MRWAIGVCACALTAVAHAAFLSAECAELHFREQTTRMVRPTADDLQQMPNNIRSKFSFQGVGSGNVYALGTSIFFNAAKFRPGIPLVHIARFGVELKIDTPGVRIVAQVPDDDCGTTAVERGRLLKAIISRSGPGAEVTVNNNITTTNQPRFGCLEAASPDTHSAVWSISPSDEGLIRADDLYLFVILNIERGISVVKGSINLECMQAIGVPFLGDADCRPFVDIHDPIKFTHYTDEFFSNAGTLLISLKALQATLEPVRD